MTDARPLVEATEIVLDTDRTEEWVIPAARQVRGDLDLSIETERKVRGQYASRRNAVTLEAPAEVSSPGWPQSVEIVGQLGRNGNPGQ